MTGFICWAGARPGFVVGGGAAWKSSKSSSIKEVLLQVQKTVPRKQYHQEK